MENAISYSMHKEGLTAKATFETRFIKGREQILRIYSYITRVQGRGNCKQVQRLSGESILDVHEEQQGHQVTFERAEEERQSRSERASGARSGRGLVGHSQDLDLFLTEMESR